ncbi:thiol-disulfide isomerase/thioredoxin [Hymenobacter luteus]|uniref:Thiol-disulfide isomerase/thioredoxin n=2 Tax=Hymenobacter TaxID=89966 RepID=A0A7W9T0E8_9BACT|nr:MULTISPECIES: thioredoxin family protein [Hymenobacter]MBB4602294.1 thiol-disulfide isomerase/thioredoxin [Hymenobacter latericoloratus]MBB6059277.1 thiol-disulfide isomerase/thioredoxin [Hymenobacter luteus]
MKVIDTNDIGLRTLIHDYPRVLAKFTSENCEVCDLLAPPFERFATEERFQKTVFLRLDADENPVARKMMAAKVAPFFVAYCRGRLLECDTLRTEKEVLEMLSKLQTCPDELVAAQ